VTSLIVGVLDVKNSGDWATEKWSIRNKKDYATRHGMLSNHTLLNWKTGYELVVKDMSLKRKYAHEWRESWEKIDIIRDVMRQFPHHEWFWWLDLVCSSLSFCIDCEAYVHHGTLSFAGCTNFLSTRPDCDSKHFSDPQSSRNIGNGPC
jgi:hypothetical protein